MKKVIGLVSLIFLCVIVFVPYNHSNASINTDPGRSKAAAVHKLTRLNFEDSIHSIYQTIGLQKVGLSYDAFRYGIIGYYSLKQAGQLSDKPLISIIDFTRKSTEKRFYTIDLKEMKLKFHSLVSHGRNTGEDVAASFSNIPNSNQSSLGFYLTGETYIGSKGYSLRLDGLDKGYNDKMRDRAVVMHDAPYVSEEWIAKYGRLGRSQGCPALPKGLAKQVIDTIKEKTLVFAYYNDDKFLTASTHLQLNQLFENLEMEDGVVAKTNY